MKITEEWLEKENACPDGVVWWKSCRENDGRETVKKLIAAKRFGWANWLIVRLMDRPQRIQYAVYSAELVLGNYEKAYPGDARPRQAIEAAKAVLKESTLENLIVAKSAADSADSAAYSAADSAAYGAAYCAAKSAAYCAACSTEESTAYNAAYSATYSVCNGLDRATEKGTGMRIIAYGLKLLAEG